MTAQSAGPRFAFDDDDRELRLGVFDELRGFFTGHTAIESFFYEDQPDWYPVEFVVVGLRPEVPIEVGELSWTDLWVLADSGEPIGVYQVGATELVEVDTRPDGAVDVSVIGLMSMPPETGVDSNCDRWRAGPPTVPGTWGAWPAARREAWLEVSRKYRPRDPLRRGSHDRGGVVSMPGRDIIDLASFYCAFGEAVYGPGGHAGNNPFAMRDHLTEPDGVPTPFTLIWSDFAVAEQHLGEHLQIMLATLDEAGVTVVRE